MQRSMAPPSALVDPPVVAARRERNAVAMRLFDNAASLLAHRAAMRSRADVHRSPLHETCACRAHCHRGCGRDGPEAEAEAGTTAFGRSCASGSTRP